MRILTSLLLVLASGMLFAQSSTLELSASVYFETASDQLDKSAREAIASFQQELSAYADYTIRLEAFTDERGEEDYNETLAMDRAASVRTFLEAQGTTTTGLEVTTWGERQARRGTDDENALRSDRRVDLVATVTTWTDMEEVLHTLRRDQLQTFVADLTEDYTVKGDRGGRFLIGAGSLVDAEGNPATGPVNIELTEAYTFDDILLAGLTTHSGDRLLETGGMFRIEATDEAGNELFLADGKNIAGSIPTDDFNEQMRLFAGLEHDDGELADWELTPGRVVASTASLIIGGPRLLQMSPQTGEEMAIWLRLNPEPEIDAVKRMPRERPVPTFPDTAVIEWKPSGIGDLFTSRTKRQKLTQNLKQKAVREYNSAVSIRERAIRTRKENMAFNLGREDRYEVALSTWYDAREAEQQRLAKETEAWNEAMRLDYEKRREAWLANRMMKLEDALTGVDVTGKQQELSRYFFSVTQLGWANCDVFYGEEDPVEVVAEAPGSDRNSTIVLIPDGRRSVLAYSPKSGEDWACQGVPRGKSYQLIAYQIREGRIEFAQQQIMAAGEGAETLSFRPVGVEELKELLKGIVPAK